MNVAHKFSSDFQTFAEDFLKSNCYDFLHNPVLNYNYDRYKFGKCFGSIKDSYVAL